MREREGARLSIVAVGPVTVDEIDGVERPGGAVCYVARAIEALGGRLRVLTTAAADADLGALEGHEVEVVAGPRTLRFRLETVDGRRRLRVEAESGRRLGAGDLPAGWGDSGILVLAPLTADDLDVASFLDLPFAGRSVLAQGLQRVIDEDGAVRLRDRPSEELLALASATTSVFLSRSEAAAWPGGAVERLASRMARVVVTHGAEGATVHRAGAAPLEVTAEPARVVDTTGAGDAFAAAYTWALAAGMDDVEAGRLASLLAARTTEVLGAGKLPEVSRAGAA